MDDGEWYLGISRLSNAIINVENGVIPDGLGIP